MEKMNKWTILGILVVAVIVAFFLFQNNAPSPSWKTDGITMMRIPETGQLACFGCGATMCIDPIPTLQPVEETQQQHCNDTFEITSN